MRTLIKHSLEDYPLAMLCLGLAVYAAFGLPTPDNPGAVEIFIGACLIIGVGAYGLGYALHFQKEEPRSLGLGRVFLIYALSLPMISGLLHEGNTGLMIRDLAALLFMLLPVFLAPRIQTHVQEKIFTGAVLLIAASFAIRAILEAPSLIWIQLNIIPAQAELTYLANAPILLWAAILSAGIAIKGWAMHPTMRSLFISAILFTCSALLLVPAALTLQRATLAAFALSLGCIALYYLWQRPKPTIFLLMLASLIMLPFYSELVIVIDALAQKSDLVGLNMRLQELSAVWQEIASSPLSILFGEGWGATFKSPAVGDLRVNFTHSLLSSLLLKTGVIGLILGASYIATILLCLRPLLFKSPVVTLALASPILIDTFLYAAFKSLDFGLLLCLAVIHAKSCKLSETPLRLSAHSKLKHK